MLFLALLSDVKNLQQQLFMNIVIKKIRKNTKINLTWFDNILIFTGPIKEFYFPGYIIYIYSEP